MENAHKHPEAEKSWTVRPSFLRVYKLAGNIENLSSLVFSRANAEYSVCCLCLKKRGILFFFPDSLWAIYAVRNQSVKPSCCCSYSKEY